MLAYLSILLKMFVRTAKIIHNKSLENKYSSIPIYIMVVWFRHVYLQVIL